VILITTSLVSIFAALWVIAILPTIDPKAFLALLKSPICWLPIALFALSVIGTLWSDARWGVRLYAISPTAKLLVLPIIFYHFERSTRGMWVLASFLISCTLLMAMSWIVAFDPGLSLKPREDAERGIFVKNYIDQSQEFALCAVALAYPILAQLRAKRVVQALAWMVLSLGFAINMIFVIVSRTALVTVPIMVGVFALLHLRKRNVAMIACSATALACLAWVASPQLRMKTGTFLTEYRLYKEYNAPTSIGQRLEFWHKSLVFFAEAPVFGHGTGSTRDLFAQAAMGQSGAAAQIVGNPHNQTLNVAIQWGMLGVVLLYAMWLLQLLSFRGEGLVAWIGSLVIVQNMLTSLFNSHIFDFHEGWMYVLGVGVTGGMLSQKNVRIRLRPGES
jgi:O-antigen ligase